MVMIVVVVVLVVVMGVTMMRVIVIARRYRGADGGGAVEHVQERHERSALHPQQSHSDDDDEQVADDFDHIDRAAHGRRGRVQHRSRHAYEHHRDQRLHQRRGERQDHAARPGLVIRDDVRRDHRLAVAGTGGVKNAVEERQSEQGPGGAAVGLGGAEQARKLAIEFRLLGEDPTEHAAHRRRRRLRTRRAERGGLSKCAVDQPGRE